MPGPNVASHAATSAAYPSRPGSGTGSSPSQARIDVHWGREIRQWPPLRPRTMSASTPSWPSTRGAIGKVPP